MLTLRKMALVATGLALQVSLGNHLNAQKPPAAGAAGAAGNAAAAAAPRAGLTGPEITRATGMLKKGEAVDKDLLERYVKHELTKLTVRDPKDAAGKDLASYALVRTNLINMIRTSGSEQAKSIAAKAVLNMSKFLVSNPRLTPATRVNAVLSIAELDTDSKKPNPEAFDVLLAIAKDPKVEISLRISAVYGLVRHANYGAVVAAKKPQLAQEMVTLFNSQPNSPLDRAAHSWLVRRSLDVLSALNDPKAALSAIDKLADVNEQPSVRVASAEYLSKLDLAKLPDDKKTLYFLGLSQMLEKQLVIWHKREHGRIKAKSGGGMGSGMGMGGGMGSGMGMDMGGMGMDMGGMGMGGDSGGMGMDMGMGAEGGYGGMPGGDGGYGGMGGSQPRSRPVDVQPWDVRLSRRYLNHLAQVAHMALDGRAVKPTTRAATGAGQKGLINQGLPADLQEKAKEMVEAVELLQLRINSPTNASKLTTMTSLLNQVETKIEAVMDLVRKTPGFMEKYPEYKEGEELSTIDEPKPEEPAKEGDKPADGAPAADAPAGEEPAADAPAADAPASEAAPGQ